MAVTARGEGAASDGRLHPDTGEREADRPAAEALIPEEVWAGWARQAPHSTAGVLALAQSVRAHPAVVAGRLRHQTGDYREFSRMLGTGSVRRQFAAQ